MSKAKQSLQAQNNPDLVLNSRRTDNRVVECSPCPPGFECPNPQEPPRPCPPDYMSLGGLVACHPCPFGEKQGHVRPHPHRHASFAAGTTFSSAESLRLESVWSLSHVCCRLHMHRRHCRPEAVAAGVLPRRKCKTTGSRRLERRQRVPRGLLLPRRSVRAQAVLARIR